MVNLAIIGDIHYQFSADDVTYFNESDYDLVLLVGDLSDYAPRRGYQVARLISGLKKPALMIPGNHDTVNLLQLLAELKRKERLAAWLGAGQVRREQHLQRCLQPVVLGGYSRHAYAFSGYEFDVIVARPYSMGGPSLNFKTYLRRRFGVRSMADSVRLLKSRIDQAESNQILFLAHNGPHGQGGRRTDLWGCDFMVEEGDYGDRDLELAIEYASSSGRQVVAVVAGHMHHQLKGGGSRHWRGVHQGLQYLNAARVPRVWLQDGWRCRHHVRLSFGDDRVEVEERVI